MSRWIVTSLVAVLPLVVLACASETAPPPRVAANATTTTPTTVALPAPTKSASESSVSIADDILKACGISTDEAFFPFDSTSVLPQSVRPLDDLARCFSAGPLQGRAMRVVGRADPRGDGDYNFALGQRRADAVATYVEGRGVRQTQVATTSRGAMDATGSDEKSWARDRNVEILLGSK